MKKQQKKKVKVKFKIRDEDASFTPSVSYEGASYDIMLHAIMAKFTSYISPSSFGLALYDWSAHLAMSPAKRFDLLRKLVGNGHKYMMYAQSKLRLNPYGSGDEFVILPRAGDNRFASQAWQTAPFNLYSQAFLEWENWWNLATSNIRGVSRHHEHIMNFAGRQLLDLYSPSNYPLTNPEVIEKTIKTAGTNFIEGYSNFLEDTYRSTYHLPAVGADAFPVGVKVAITPGKVIYRNHLIELIGL